MSTHVFYHSADLDGHCSGAICKYAMPDAILHGINYGDAFPWNEITLDDTVYMVDFSLQPFSDMIRLQASCEEFIWIDHHISAMREYWNDTHEIFIAGHRSVDFAACELCWHYLIDGHTHFNQPVNPLPLSVYWLGRYDIWKHEDAPGSLEFQYGMRLYDTWPENQEFWGELFQENKLTGAIRDEGAMLLLYEKKQNEKFAAAYAFETELDGLKCIAVNKGMSNSLVFESVYDEVKHDAMLSFAYRGGKWTVSLYATKAEVDVSVICKARGGGGHKGAAGFQCDTLPFIKAE